VVIPIVMWDVPWAIVCIGNAHAVMGRTIYTWELPLWIGMSQAVCGLSHKTLSSNAPVHKKYIWAQWISVTHWYYVIYGHQSLVNTQGCWTMWTHPFYQSITDLTSHLVCWDNKHTRYTQGCCTMLSPPFLPSHLVCWENKHKIYQGWPLESICPIPHMRSDMVTT
jgi:hypothetical protein